MSPLNEPGLIARASVQAFQAVSNVAQKYDHTAGNHGGEAIMIAQSTFSIPIDPVIMETSVSTNSEKQRFTAIEVRFGQMSILTVVACFWCSEGFTSRIWGIFQQIACLIQQHKLPF